MAFDSILFILMNSYTTDTFFNGKIRITQDRTGYRFSIDAVLLAYFADPRSGNKVLDLGTGCGIIPLILAYRQPNIAIYGVEVQTELAELAVSNVRENQIGRPDYCFLHRYEIAKTGYDRRPGGSGGLQSTFPQARIRQNQSRRTTCSCPP